MFEAKFTINFEIESRNTLSIEATSMIYCEILIE